MLPGAALPAEPKLVTKKRSGLKIELLDPFKVWLDPTGRNRYVIEETETDYDELQKMAQLNPRDWDAEAIGRLVDGAHQDQKSYDETRQRANQDSGTTPPWRKPVILRTFWGDVVNEETREVERNVTFTVAGTMSEGSTFSGQELVGKVRPIPDWHVLLDRRLKNKRGPLVWGFPFRVPLAPYGKGLGRDNLDLAVLHTDLLNMVGDQALFAGLNAFRARVDRMANPEEFKDGVYPGKTYTEDGPGDPVIQALPLGQITPQLPGIIGLFDREYQNSVIVTNYIEPATPAKQTPTLGEYQGRQSQSLGLLDMVARNLEDQLLEPFLEVVYWLTLQYMDDFSLPEVVEVLGPDAAMLAAMSPAQRFQFLKANVRMSARGMSVVLAREAELQKIAAFVQGIPALRQVIPDIQQRINPDALLRKTVEGFQWDPDEILVKPQQTAIEQEAAIPGAEGLIPGSEVAPAVPMNGAIEPAPLPVRAPRQPFGAPVPLGIPGT